MLYRLLTQQNEYCQEILNLTLSPPIPLRLYTLRSSLHYF